MIFLFKLFKNGPVFMAHSVWAYAACAKNNDTIRIQDFITLTCDKNWYTG